MAKKIALGIAAGVAAVGLMVATAGAWTYGLTGSGECQQDGTFKITWVVDNSTEEQALNIKKSSNETVVPVGAQVPANSSSDFTQTVPGTAGSTSLTLKGNWEGDKEKQTREATVTLQEDCEKPKVEEPPVVPPTPVPTTPAPLPEAIQGK